MYLANSPSQFSNHPLNQSIILQNQSRVDTHKRQIQQNQRYHQMALQNFPFGKQGIKISQYVSNQLNSKQQQDNVRILEQFRRKAIADKFHNKYGHLQNSRTMQKYITQSMLPGVTLNPSIADQFNNDSNSRSFVYNSSLKKADIAQHYTQPTNMATIKNHNSQFNARRKQQLSLPYHSIISYSTLNPQKATINSEVQTQENSQQIKKNKEIDLQRKYYKLKLKSSKKQLKKFGNLEKMLRKLNQQIQHNSKFIEKAMAKNQKSRSHHKKGRAYTLRDEFQGSDTQRKREVIYPKPRLRTEDRKQNQGLKNWKLNNKILYNSSTSSSFFDESGKKLAVRPKIEYVSQGKKNVQKMQNFVGSLKPNKKQSLNQYESTRDYRIKDDEQKAPMRPGIEDIREHLKLLKRHTGRLETINGYSLVS